jgi:hypothetical protein
MILIREETDGDVTWCDVYVKSYKLDICFETIDLANEFATSIAQCSSDIVIERLGDNVPLSVVFLEVWSELHNARFN